MCCVELSVYFSFLWKFEREAFRRALIEFKAAKMKLRMIFKSVFETLDSKVRSQFGFQIKDATFTKLVDYMYKPKDPSSLAVTRILFGLSMLLDIPDERGGAIMDKRWGDPKTCHFPLLPFIRPFLMPYMALVYAALWIGACGITLGYKYRFTATLFTICYWYLFVIDKSYWNNHSYLFGLVALLLTCTDAGGFWSLDVYYDRSKLKTEVPYWNYFVLKYQFFILYFMAGMKKGTAEWLTGYSVRNLSEHWVFQPFRLFLTIQQTDYLIVHWFVFIFDLTVAIWMMYSHTRHVAMLFCAMFHLMNTRLFRIGMFPWVCLATMPLFYSFDWPKKLIKKYKEQKQNIKSIVCRLNEQNHCVCKLKGNENSGKHNKLTKEENDNAKQENVHTKEKNQETSQENEHTIQENEQTKQENKETQLNEHTKQGNVQMRQENESIRQNNQHVKEDNLENENKIENVKENSIEKVKSGNENYIITTNNNLNKPIHFEKENDQCTTNKGDLNNLKAIDFNSDIKRKWTVFLILIYVFVQVFLPYSHFITKGYNNWINGLYGYSWDMMVHTWDSHSVILKVVDNDNKREFFLDPYIYSPNDRWTRHGDMVYQYAQCIKENLINEIDFRSRHFSNKNKAIDQDKLITKDNSINKVVPNVSLYVDVWCSLNGRFTQRMFDPKVDLLNADWSPFRTISFLMPLLDEKLHWREDLDRMKKEVHSWNNNSDVIFLADFPGYEQEKFIPFDLRNVTLTILEGTVIYEPEVTKLNSGHSYQLKNGDRKSVYTESFHKIKNIGITPAFYMYTFYNGTEDIKNYKQDKPKLPILNELYERFMKMAKFFNLIIKSLLGILFSGKCL